MFLNILGLNRGETHTHEIQCIVEFGRCV